MTNLLRNDEDRVCARSTQPPRVSVDRSTYEVSLLEVYVWLPL